jgi:hypothetical protein
MKKLVYLLLLMIVSTGVYAQSKELEEVAAAVEQINKGLLNADKEILQGLTLPELSYGHSSGKIENQSEFVEALVSGTVKISSIDISDQTITITGNNAVVRHIFSAKISSNGTDADIKIGALMVWLKQNGKWKLLARQGYKLS